MSASFIDRIADKVTSWIGSTASIIFHSCFFVFAFVSHWLFSWSFDSILLVLTTVVSLEAIYFSIFIQRAVNQQAERLGDVEESLDDVEDSLDDVEEALEEDEQEEEAEEESLEDVVTEMKKVLKEMKKMAKEKK